ncbi:MAG: hypothetical protein Q9225_000727 [Loekoesia sp. 1 TL-2023]
MKIHPPSIFSYLVVIYSLSFSLLVYTSPTAPNDRPVTAIAPAAWHSPVHYQLFADQLHVAGLSTVMLQLPSCGSSNPRAQSVANDAAFIKKFLLQPSIDAGKRVVLITHSYSGGPGAVAAKGLSVGERRAAGKPGGIIGLVFISAFVAKQGQSLISGSGGQYAPWVIQYVSVLCNSCT